MNEWQLCEWKIDVASSCLAYREAVRILEVVYTFGCNSSLLSAHLKLWWQYRLGAFHKVNRTYPLHPRIIFRSPRSIWSSSQHILREAHVEGICLLDLLHIFIPGLQPQRFNIALQKI